MQHLLDELSAHLPGTRVTSYDGSASGPADAATILSIASPLAFVQLMRAPRGLGLARAWVTGTITIQGDLHSVVRQERSLRSPKLYAATAAALATALPAVRLGDVLDSGRTPIEYRRRRPGTHRVRRDLDETDFHYSRALEFYRYLLGPSLTYSCALFTSPDESLESAQANKHSTICRKLKIGSESTVLDIGCGWGSFLRYAAGAHGCRGIGITASREQHAQILSDPDLSQPTGNLRFRYGDYRQLLPMKGVTAAASIGVYEHVGAANSRRFFELIRCSLEQGALYLNQSIVRRTDGPVRFRSSSFTQRFIFPNGQLLSLPKQLRDLERSRFQVLSAELYGLSYAQTLRKWIGNLQANWDACVSLEGEQRVRAWQMYLTGSLTRFERRSIDVVQVLSEAR